MQGQELDSSLSPEGRAEIAAALARLADVLRGDRIAALYTSPLLRAKESAEVIQAVVQLPIEPLPQFLEKSVGSQAGVSWIVAREKLPGARAVECLKYDFSPYGGESFDGFSRRVMAGLGILRRNHPGERVVIVAHEGVIRTVYGLLGKLCPESIPNGSIHEFALES